MFQDLIRISVGTEHIDDIIADFEQSFKNAATKPQEDGKKEEAQTPSKEPPKKEEKPAPAKEEKPAPPKEEKPAPPKEEKKPPPQPRKEKTEQPPAAEKSPFGKGSRGENRV